MTKDESNTLTILAQRVNPNNKSWWKACSKSDLPFPFQCCICATIISGTMPMIEHGWNHLKKKGLLVFV